MPENNPYSSLDFNQDGDVNNLELAAAHEQSGEISGKKKSRLRDHISVGIGFILFGILFSMMGWADLDLRIVIPGISVAVISAAYIVFSIVRYHKKKNLTRD